MLVYMYMFMYGYIIKIFNTFETFKTFKTFLIIICTKSRKVLQDILRLSTFCSKIKNLEIPSLYLVP